MFKKGFIVMLCALMVVFSLQVGVGTVEASYSEPAKAVVQVSRGNSISTTVDTEIYLNATNAKKFIKDQESQQTKASDAAAFLISLVPYFGVLYGAHYLIQGWSYKDNVAEAEKLLKSNKGIKVKILEVKGKGSSGPSITGISGWDGKRSSLSHTKGSSTSSGTISTTIKVDITE